MDIYLGLLVAWGLLHVAGVLVASVAQLYTTDC